MNLTKEEKMATDVKNEKITFSDLNWQAYIPIGIAVILLGWFFTPIFKEWYKQWMMDESYYSHGILVPFISLFIVWLKKKILKEVPIEPYTLGLFILAPTLIAIILLMWAGSVIAAGLAFPLVVAALVLTLFGRRITRELVFPLGYLYFMCVLPGFILIMMSFRIQQISTTGGVFLLKLMTFDAYRDGVWIILPNIVAEVGDACSGFRLLISLFAFAFLFAYLKEGPWWGKAILVASTVPLSLLVNSIRIALVVMVGEFYGSTAMNKFHDYSGYIVLVLAFIILSLLARLVKCRKFNSMLTS